MSAVLMMSAFGALVLSSGIALTAAKPEPISAAEHEQAFAAMRERVGRP